MYLKVDFGTCSIFILVPSIFSALLNHKYNLNKSSQLLQIFASCTNHYINEISPITVPSYSSDIVCKGSCVNVQTTKSFYSVSEFGNNTTTLNIDFHTKNISLYQKRFTLKHRFQCTTALFLAKTLEYSTLFANKLIMRLIYNPELVNAKYKLYQFDYIFIPIHMNYALIQNTFFNATFLTRAAIILISTKNSRLYFSMRLVIH